MSLEGEDDTELRDLVATTLQSCGVLGKIKAQLRSNVYLALEGEDELKQKSTHLNPKLDDFANTSEGRLVMQLIREFLTFFNLDFTQSVFEPEAMEGRHVSSRNREKLIESLGFAPENLNTELPLLSEIVKLSKVSVLKSETPTPTEEYSNKFLFNKSPAAFTTGVVGGEDETNTSLQSFEENSNATHKSSLSASYMGTRMAQGGGGNTPTRSLTPENSFSRPQPDLSLKTPTSQEPTASKQTDPKPFDATFNM